MSTKTGANLSRRRFLQATAAATGSAALTRLGVSAAPKSTSRLQLNFQNGTQKVRALMWSNSPTIDGNFKKRVKTFNDLNKDKIEINLQFLPYDQYWQKLQLAYSANEPYDIYFWDVQAYGHYRNGLLLDLQPMIDKAGLFDPAKYPVKLFEPWKLDGKDYYAMPENFQTMGLYYNKDIISKAGGQMPAAGWTWDQVIEAAKGLTKKSGSRTTQWGMVLGDMYNWWGMQTLSWDQDTAFFDKIIEPTKFQFSDPRNVKALKYIQDWVFTDKVTPTPTEAGQNPELSTFQSGRIGISPQGSWNIAATSEVKFGWDVTAMPTYAGKSVVPYFMGGWVIAKASKVPEGAFEWARWCATDFQDTMASDHDWIPILNSARQSEAMFKDMPSGYKEMVASLDNAKLGDLYCKNNQQIWVEVFTPGINDLLNKDKDAADVAAAFDKGANKLLQ
jgi:multiple sugar transport system substrate-binding protein